MPTQRGPDAAFASAQPVGTVGGLLTRLSAIDSPVAGDVTRPDQS